MWGINAVESWVSQRQRQLESPRSCFRRQPAFNTKASATPKYAFIVLRQKFLLRKTLPSDSFLISPSVQKGSEASLLALLQHLRGRETWVTCSTTIVSQDRGGRLDLFSTSQLFCCLATRVWETGQEEVTWQESWKTQN